MARLHRVMAVLLAVRFLAELGMLACLGLAGWRLGSSSGASFALAIGVPLVAAAVWGRWVAPRASRRLRDPRRLALEVVLFGATLAVVLLAEPARWLVVLTLAVCGAFLVSIPARRHEPLATSFPSGADPGPDIPGRD